MTMWQRRAGIQNEDGPPEGPPLPASPTGELAPPWMGPGPDRSSDGGYNEQWPLNGMSGSTIPFRDPREPYVNPWENSFNENGSEAIPPAASGGLQRRGDWYDTPSSTGVPLPQQDEEQQFFSHAGTDLMGTPPNSRELGGDARQVYDWLPDPQSPSPDLQTRRRAPPWMGA